MMEQNLKSLVEQQHVFPREPDKMMAPASQPACQMFSVLTPGFQSEQQTSAAPPPPRPDPYFPRWHLVCEDNHSCSWGGLRVTPKGEKEGTVQLQQSARCCDLGDFYLESVTAWLNGWTSKAHLKPTETRGVRQFSFNP